MMIFLKTFPCNICFVVYFVFLLSLLEVTDGLSSLSSVSAQLQQDSKVTEKAASNNRTDLRVRPEPPGVVSGDVISSTGSSHDNSRATRGGLSVTSESSRPLPIQRALYALVAASAVVIIYFIIRTVRMRKKFKKTRRYGVLDTNLAMEMTPLEQDDEEEDDTTVFDATHSRRAFLEVALG
ncbi:membrane protein FAM174-like isoform X1 [Polypterus senegalus]|uniref:membrane protein FAM174-like isoform X1 n=2 Tax=Polypterus senegalus TaxID=55291 RepID=UPI0019650989|nr:membrane protein FAM174-like isoform X1 [Polypterus senegalus]